MTAVPEYVILRHALLPWIQVYNRRWLWRWASPECKKSKYNRSVGGCVHYFLFLCFDAIKYVQETLISQD